MRLPSFNLSYHFPFGPMGCRILAPSPVSEDPNSTLH